ncbi:MAG: redox-sensing transcriptional repressor Rex [Armatimonadota bacterium]
MSTEGKPKAIPQATLERMATYLRIVSDLDNLGTERISSSEMQQIAGFSAAQFRKDLSYFGDFGTPGVGYSVKHLRQRIAKIMNTDHTHSVLLVGAGKLGSALAEYDVLRQQNFHIMAIFDTDPDKIGRSVAGITVHSVEHIHDVNKCICARLGIITVPVDVAQQVTDQLVEAGVDGILNFAATIIKVPPHVKVRYFSMKRELALLAYFLEHPFDECFEAE